MELLVGEPQGSLYICSQHPAIVAASEKLKRSGAPASHAEKQHGPIVTTVGFWIQYNKIALSLFVPSHPASLWSDLTLSWEKSQDVFFFVSSSWTIL